MSVSAIDTLTCDAMIPLPLELQNNILKQFILSFPLEESIRQLASTSSRCLALLPNNRKKILLDDEDLREFLNLFSKSFFLARSDYPEDFMNFVKTTPKQNVFKTVNSEFLSLIRHRPIQFAQLSYMEVTLSQSGLLNKLLGSKLLWCSITQLCIRATWSKFDLQLTGPSWCSTFSRLELLRLKYDVYVSDPSNNGFAYPWERKTISKLLSMCKTLKTFAISTPLSMYQEDEVQSMNDICGYVKSWTKNCPTVIKVYISFGYDDEAGINDDDKEYQFLYRLGRHYLFRRWIKYSEWFGCMKSGWKYQEIRPIYYAKHVREICNGRYAYLGKEEDYWQIDEEDRDPFLPMDEQPDLPFS